MQNSDPFGQQRAVTSTTLATQADAVTVARQQWAAANPAIIDAMMAGAADPNFPADMEYRRKWCLANLAIIDALREGTMVAVKRELLVAISLNAIFGPEIEATLHQRIDEVLYGIDFPPGIASTPGPTGLSILDGLGMKGDD